MAYITRRGFLKHAFKKPVLWSDTVAPQHWFFELKNEEQTFKKFTMTHVCIIGSPSSKAIWHYNRAVIIQAFSSGSVSFAKGWILQSSILSSNLYHKTPH